MLPLQNDGLSKGMACSLGWGRKPRKVGSNEGYMHWRGVTVDIGQTIEQLE